jgi:hypothetical protein
MLPEEEPEQQLLHVSDAQVAEHQVAKKAAADKAAGAAAGGLGGFAGAKAGSGGKQAAADKKAAAGAATPVKQACSAGSADASQHGASEASAAPCTLSEAQLRKLQVERQRIVGEWRGLISLLVCRGYGHATQHNKRTATAARHHAARVAAALLGH